MNKIFFGEFGHFFIFLGFYRIGLHLTLVFLYALYRISPREIRVTLHRFLSNITRISEDFKSKFKIQNYN